MRQTCQELTLVFSQSDCLFLVRHWYIALVHWKERPKRFEEIEHFRYLVSISYYRKLNMELGDELIYIYLAYVLHYTYRCNGSYGGYPPHRLAGAASRLMSHWNYTSPCGMQGGVLGS